MTITIRYEIHGQGVTEPLESHPSGSEFKTANVAINHPRAFNILVIASDGRSGNAVRVARDSDIRDVRLSLIDSRRRLAGGNPK